MSGPATGTSPYARLDELTGVKNDFDATIRSYGLHTPRERYAASGTTLQRVEQLEADQRSVMEARGDEVGRLLDAGHSVEELTERLEATDAWRHGPPDAVLHAEHDATMAARARAEADAEAGPEAEL